MTARPRPADDLGIATAVDALARGRLVVHPTETVISLSGDPYDERAVGAARRIKGYAEARPFLCLVPGLAEARDLAADWPVSAGALAEAFWPGPLTLVVSAGPGAPPEISAGSTIAMRPAVDTVSGALLAAWNRPLFSTSANRRGESPTVDVIRALAGLATAADSDAIEVALEGGSAGAAAGLPSTIVDLTTAPPRIVRAGAIPSGVLRAVLPDLVAPDR